MWLEAVPATHVAAVRWTPDVAASALAVTVRLARTHQRPMLVRVQLALGEISVADDVYAVDGDEVTREIALPSTVTSLGRRGYLWSPEHPNLMTATVTLLEGDTVVDEVGSYTAMRSVRRREAAGSC